MHSNLYIPTKIKVGFQKRKDTFTGKLGFITYTDEKGNLRQENSWENWRDKSIKPVEFDNVPRSNFIFNKDVNRNGYWSDVTKVRIYDSRDFEFEIDVSNMMYILMHSDISKRDIIEECVFAWNGKNVVLLPVNSEEYRTSIENTRKLNTKFSTKDLTLGYTYLTKKLGDVVYLGYHDWSELRYMGNSRVRQGVGKKHIFYVNRKYCDKFMALEAKDLVEVSSNEVNTAYSGLVEELFKSDSMKKSGKFTVKKGFESIGYKKTAYSTLKVEIGEKSYQMYEVLCSVSNDKPSINTKQLNHWQANEYERDMRDENINTRDMNQVRDFFNKNGFGELYYVDATGQKNKM